MEYQMASGQGVVWTKCGIFHTMEYHSATKWKTTNERDNSSTLQKRYAE